MARRQYGFPLIITTLIVVLIVVVAVVSAYWPKYEEHFFELALLGKDKMSEAYFPNNNSTIGKNSTILWHIYLHNHMGSDQSVLVRMKLLNSTMRVPNDLNHTASPQAPFLELPLVLSIDEIVQIPFSWSIVEADPQNGSIFLMVNNDPVTVDGVVFSDNRLRLVFELWVYNPNTDLYEFGWDSGKGYYSTSNYMWFSLSPEKFELALFGKDKMSEAYFPNNNSTIGKNSTILWHIYLHNLMGSEQTVLVRVKLLNSTMRVPNDLNHTASPQAPFLELPLVLSIDEIVQIPFSWSIVEADPQNGSIFLMVNNDPVTVDGVVFSDNRLRLVFELWVYNPNTDLYEFGWDSGKGYYSTSNYMWFSLAPDTR